MEQYFENANSPSPSFPHAFSGNPGGFRTGPPIKAFGGDDFGSPIFTAAPLSREDTKNTKCNNQKSCPHFVPFVIFVAKLFGLRGPHSFSIFFNLSIVSGGWLIAFLAIASRS
jgi:hypothetical protein